MSCPSCGAAVADAAACQSLYDGLSLRFLESSGIPYAARRLAVDCYCLQHPDRYCVSAKSLAAHLTGVAWALEFGASGQGLESLQRWLNGAVALVKPELPARFGQTTVADVAGSPDLEVATEGWARSVWAAYASLHPLARRWVEAATGRR